MILESHTRPPLAGAYMARAFLPSPGLPKDGSFPQIVERWVGLRIDRDHLAAFRAAVGARDGDAVCVLYPHVLGFRLQMALLTHPAFPLPIWNALQIRNRLVRRRVIEPGATIEMETRTAQHRRVDKGLEVELHTRLSQGTALLWESWVTYFYRGRFGASDGQAQPAAPPDLRDAAVAQRLRMPPGDGWKFGSLTGDYNGIHCFPWYARRFGFRTAFLHPQRVAGLCMARLAGPRSEAQTLELWLKGPVFYGEEVALSANARDGVVQFGLALAGDSRMALLGSWQGATAPI
jgi:acyl dehydratase